MLFTICCAIKHQTFFEYDKCLYFPPPYFFCNDSSWLSVVQVLINPNHYEALYSADILLFLPAPLPTKQIVCSSLMTTYIFEFNTQFLVAILSLPLFLSGLDVQFFFCFLSSSDFESYFTLGMIPSDTIPWNILLWYVPIENKALGLML